MGSMGSISRSIYMLRKEIFSTMLRKELRKENFHVRRYGRKPLSQSSEPPPPGVHAVELPLPSSVGGTCDRLLTQTGHFRGGQGSLSRFCLKRLCFSPWVLSYSLTCLSSDKPATMLWTALWGAPGVRTDGSASQTSARAWGQPIATQWAWEQILPQTGLQMRQQLQPAAWLQPHEQPWDRGMSLVMARFLVQRKCAILSAVRSH